MLHDLQDVQHPFLRRLLGFNCHSLLAVLLTETGQMAMGVRRLLRGLLPTHVHLTPSNLLCMETVGQFCKDVEDLVLSM
ncbi:hypothetical protein R3P38DRAFT_2925854 [Favolaschia claudopus]|uniref:Uncharacterized protein n=1 Tax=Favolaschia claudopus TaxID=2862362 RepID=A0AAW0BXF8_9AGAR